MQRIVIVPLPASKEEEIYWHNNLELLLLLNMKIVVERFP